ncbi:inorganic diphosphatase [Aggregatilinea lenta]|uniref:inorganic diphosphatase n=1 Tax=Aggregatilinea lenta TaxID=913108 RepID=UPI000E5AFB85|nr:inorganic diphosphatase [Aggregatilinea lenta]
MINLWQSLPSGPDIPDVIYCIVEIPKGSRNKYEYSKKSGVIKLDRVLYSPMHYPSDYGLVPQTYAEDGDPLDILVMVNEATFAGCVIEARPIGIFHMLDRGDPDEKILAVPSTDPQFDDYHDLKDVPKHFLSSVAHFFQVYKELQGIPVEPQGWEGAEVAKQAILASIDAYKKKFPVDLV